MRLTKAQRQALREKFGGRCAYCGGQLGERWHADHIQPVVRNDWLKVPRSPNHPERHVFENLNPACAPCNIDKRSLSLEDWRLMIQRSADVLTRDVSTFRRAVRYGLVEIKAPAVEFFFERAARERKPS